MDKYKFLSRFVPKEHLEYIKEKEDLAKAYIQCGMYSRGLKEIFSAFKKK